MGTTVEVPGVGTVDFPDGMDQAEITRTIKSNILPGASPGSAARSMPDGAEKALPPAPDHGGIMRRLTRNLVEDARTYAGLAKAAGRMASRPLLPTEPLSPSEASGFWTGAGAAAQAAGVPGGAWLSRFASENPGIVSGAQEFVRKQADMVTSPVGAALSVIFPTGGIVGKAAIAGFGGWVLGHLPDTYRQMKSAAESGDMEKLTELTMQAATILSAAPLAGKAALELGSHGVLAAMYARDIAAQSKPGTIQALSEAMKILDHSEPRPRVDTERMAARGGTPIVATAEPSRPAMDHVSETPSLTKGEPHASGKQSAEPLPELEVRPSVGQEAPLQQPGQGPAPAGSAQATEQPKTLKAKPKVLSPEEAASASDEGNPIVAAAVKDDEGHVHQGPNHPEIDARLGKPPTTWERRNTPEYGFVRADGTFVSRQEAARIAKDNGQNLVEFDPGEKAHSDEIASPGTNQPISEGRPRSAPTREGGPAGATTAAPSPALSVGPGAASPQDVELNTSISELAQAVEAAGNAGVAISKPVRDAAQSAFRLGEMYSASREALGKTVGGLKAVGSYVKALWENLPDTSDYMRILGRFSSDIESAGWGNRMFQKAAKRVVPDSADQEAISSWLDAGGDEETLKRGESETTPRYKPSYRKARNLDANQLGVARNVQVYLDGKLLELQREGMLEAGVENFLHRMYGGTSKGRKLIQRMQSSVVNTRRPSSTMRRSFEFDFEAEKAGLPIVKSFITRVAAYAAEIDRAIASRRAIKAMMKLKSSDGKPAIAIRGLGVPVTSEAGKEELLVKPNAIRPEDAGLYVDRSYPALRKFKFAGTDTGGNPILLEGDASVHREFASRVDALLKPSAIRQSPLGAALLGTSSTWKSTLLDFSLFHPDQIGLHMLSHRVFSVLPEIDLGDPINRELLQGGVTLGGGPGSMMDYGMDMGKSLSAMLPKVGPMMESYKEWLFKDWIPRVKMSMARKEFERNLERYGTRMSREQIASITADHANAAFGELNYVKMMRSQYWRDLSRLILLAPDFLEARGRFMAQAGTKTGDDQRAALMTQAGTLWVTARVMNYALSGDPHWEARNAFSIVAGGHAYSLRTVAGDAEHFLTHPVSFWLSRLNPMTTRPLLEMASGRDYWGRKRDMWEQAKDAINTIKPIPFRLDPTEKTSESLRDSLIVSLGGTVRKESDLTTAYNLASKWKRANMPGDTETIYDPDKDIFKPLRDAILDDNQPRAIAEIRDLVEKKGVKPTELRRRFHAYSKVPFTGKKSSEEAFLKSLGDEDRRAVESAKNLKRIAGERLDNDLSIYEATKK